MISPDLWHFFGMLLVNFWALMDMGVSCPEWLMFILDGVQGRAAALFVMLAGVGLSLLSKKIYLNHDPLQVRAHRLRIWRRAFFLFFLGFLNALIWPADILHFYALYFFAGAVLVFMSCRQLMALIFTPVIIFVLMMVLSDFDQGVDWGSMSISEWLNLPRVARHLFFNGHYPFFPWISFLIVGLWLGRQDLTNVRLRRKIMMAAFISLVLSEAVSWVFYYIAEAPEFLWELEPLLLWVSIDPWEPMPLFFFSSCGTGLLIIVMLVPFVENHRGARWLLPFVAAGQSTLTLYVLHVLFGMLCVRVMNVWHMDSSLFPLTGGILFFVLSLAGCYFWRKHFKRGPLEWVMRTFFDTSFFGRTKAVA